MTQSKETERQEELVRYSYLLQWSMLVLPPMLFASLIYLLVLRRRITHFELRTHVKWQLATCIMILVLIVAAVIFLFVGLSGVNTDSPIAIAATFVLMGGSAVFFPWLLYRLIYGNWRFAQQVPMRFVLP